MTNEELLEIISTAAREKQTQLELRECDITSLPPEIGQLTDLTRIYLNGNKLESLPPEIGNLTNLTRLYLRDNKLESLPPEIGNLTNLTHIYIRGNRLTSLPPEIGNLTKLKGLFLSDNNISSLPPELKKLTQLGNLDLTRNPIAIPPEILNNVNEPRLITQYYFKYNEGAAEAKPLNEVKMLLVGPSGAGKTSLLERLQRDRFDPQVATTLGINLETWPVEIDKQEVKVNVWDFGGGEWMHSAHQFFFTKRSLYLLAIDANKNEAENEIEYWLELIKSFGNQSPVIVVANKTDSNKLTLNRRKWQEQYPNIKTFVEVSCQENYGIPELKTIISREISALPHNIHQELDPTWWTIKQEMEQKSEIAMSLAEYQSWARSEALIEPNDQSDLLKLINDLGHVVCLRGNSSEEGKIYQSRLLVAGIYKLLNDRELQQYQGVLEKEQLDRIFELDTLKANPVAIAEAMCKMDLALEIEEQQMYLVLDLLGTEELITGEWQDNLNFQYRYRVTPPSSIITRFSIAMQKYIYENYYWRNGLILTSEENQALVKFDRNRKKLSIWVNGPEETREKFLKQICDRIYLIHKSIPGIEVEEAPGQAGRIVESEEDLTKELIELDLAVPISSEQDPTFILDDMDVIDEDLPPAQAEKATPSPSSKSIAQNTTFILDTPPSEEPSESEEVAEEEVETSNAKPDPIAETEEVSNLASNIDLDLPSEIKQMAKSEDSPEEYEDISLGRFSPQAANKSAEPANKIPSQEEETPSQPIASPMVPPPPKLDFTPVEEETQTDTAAKTPKKGPNLVLISLLALAFIGIGIGAVVYIQSQSNDREQVSQ